MDVICLGNLVFDRVYKVASLFQGPGKSHTSSLLERGGGAAATAALASAAQGAATAFWGRSGEDSEGRALAARLIQGGVDVAGLKALPGVRTPSASVLLDPAGERQIIIFSMSGLDVTPDWLPLGAVADAGAVLSDLRWQAGTEQLLDAAERCGVPVVLDADVLTPGPFVESALRRADYVICSQQALRLLVPDTADPGAALPLLAARCRNVAAVTLGDQGSLWFLDGKVSRVPAFPVAALDTTGAGDVFHGVFAARIALNRDVLQAAVAASAASALLCAAGKGWEGIPDQKAVDDFVRQHGENN